MKVVVDHLKNSDEVLRRDTPSSSGDVTTPETLRVGGPPRPRTQKSLNNSNT